METYREIPHNPDTLTGDSLYEYIASYGETGMIMSLGLFRGGVNYTCITNIEERLGKRIGDVTISIGPDEEDDALIAARIRVRDDR